MTDSDDGLSQTLSVQQHSEDDLMADAPEEFLDAIMGTLMRDPVTLPSSGQTVDRYSQTHSQVGSLPCVTDIHVLRVHTLWY